MTLREMLLQPGLCGEGDQITLRLDKESGTFVSKWGKILSAGETEDEAITAVISARVMHLEAEKALVPCK